ncbi:MAG: MBL fold metallo-hydrolase [Candidatus Wallbacteria bacterium]|nr:MBL fold metallo-hydrolase [Candidatus Wallbacteria bacterium]
MINITFLGGAGTVTGSCYLVEAEGLKLLVDCGMFQGKKELFYRNMEPLGVELSSVDGLILTHTHIDHCGRIPLIVKSGFQGKIYCHQATAQLAEITLRDSGQIQEQEAAWRTKKNERKGLGPVEPLYTLEDADKALSYFVPVKYHQETFLNKVFSFQLLDAGHILGSAMICLTVKHAGKTTSILFSGDLGRKNQPIIRDPEIVPQADYVFCEATYGNRVHESIDDTEKKLLEIFRDVNLQKGNLIIPAFAIGRTQELLYCFRDLIERHEIGDLNFFIDSPMAKKVTEVYRRALSECYDEEYLRRLKFEDPLDFPGLHLVDSVEESKKLNEIQAGNVVMSASGMCEAGRVLHHLKHNLWRKNAHILLTGYQAEGTLGRSLQGGAKTVKIMREEVVVNAQVHFLPTLSAHADQIEIIQWLSNFRNQPQLILVHGEQDGLAGLSEAVKNKFGWNCLIPAHREIMRLL